MRGVGKHISRDGYAEQVVVDAVNAADGRCGSTVSVFRGTERITGWIVEMLEHGNFDIAETEVRNISGVVSPARVCVGRHATGAGGSLRGFHRGTGSY